jgi:hypothetical protein
MPSEKVSRGHGAVDLVQRRPAEHCRFGCQETTLPVGEADSPSPAPQLAIDDPSLGQNALQSPALLPVEPAGYRDNQHQPRFDDGCPRLIVAVKSRWSMLENHEQ